MDTIGSKSGQDLLLFFFKKAVQETIETLRNKGVDISFLPLYEEVLSVSVNYPLLYSVHSRAVRKKGYQKIIL